jgi:hypothetical protein
LQYFANIAAGSDETTKDLRPDAGVGICTRESIPLRGVMGNMGVE